MERFVVFHETEGTQYSGCDEISDVIDVPDMDAAVEWSKLWVPDVTRVCGEGEERRVSVEVDPGSSVSARSMPLYIPSVRVSSDYFDGTRVITVGCIYVPIAIAVIVCAWFASLILGG